MQGINIGRHPLNRLFVPVVDYLDNCWWHLGGAGAKLNYPEPPNNFGRSPVPQDQMERWTQEVDRVTAEYARFVDTSHDYRVGKPGWFSRYGGVVDADWAIYYASDAPELPSPSFDRVTKDENWFSNLPPLPPDICVVTRVIDSAYWDLFFRDDWMFKAIWDYAQRKFGNEARPFEPRDLAAEFEKDSTGRR